VADSFEGPEKKLEIAVTPGAPSLRSLGHAFWREVVAAASAQVLSQIANEDCDAYLLSESSLFVWDERLTLITCGRTRIVSAAEHIFTRVSPADVALLVLERKNEHFPRRQPTSFREDARQLAERLPGVALRFGREHTHSVRLFHSAREYTPEPGDTTLEVLMHGICEETSQAFSTGDLAEARATGVTEVLEGFQVDDFVFEPAGYSLNALRGRDYFTFHVTPERVGSYVSFETNADLGGDPEPLVRRVVEIFRPESFDVLSFAPAGCEVQEPSVEGYRLRQRVEAGVCGYAVSFLHWYRPPREPTGPSEISL